MPTTYTPADSDVILLLESVLQEFFPRVASVDPPLQIRVLMAENDKGNALKRFGRGTVALIKRGTKEQLASEGPDLWILIDAGRWNRSNERRRRAILAHECHHIEIQYESDGKTPKTDDIGRIKVRLIPDDWVLTGFREVVEWFGADAVEREALTRVEEYLAQRILPFADPQDVDVTDQAAVVGRVREIEREEALASA